MRRENINALIEEVYSLIDQLKDAKEKAKGDYEVQSIAKPKVKSALEHLRSTLEYSAQDIMDYIEKSTTAKGLTLKRGKNVYFPYGRISLDFESSVKKNLPGLELYARDIYNLLTSMQPYISGENWLIELCEQTNKIKHDDLTSQKRHDSGSLSMPGIYIENSTNVQMRGNYFNGRLMPDVYLDSRGRSSIDPQLYPKEFQFKVNTNFTLGDTKTDVVILLTIFIEKIEGYIIKLYTLLEENRPE